MILGSPSTAALLIMLLAVTASADPPPSRPIVIEGVRVFDGREVIDQATVIVRDGLIEAVGPALVIPDHAEIIDGAGKTLIPGLIDAHTHTFDPAALRQALAFGVTTELDMFTSAPFAAAMRSQQEAGNANDRADLFSAGTLATAPGGHGTQFGLPIPTITGPEQAEGFVADRLDEGSDYIKIVLEDGAVIGRELPTLDRETLDGLVAAAHRHEVLAVVHVHTKRLGREAIESGADGLVHVWIDQPIDEDFAALAADSGVFVTPTLSVLQSVTGNAGGAGLVDDPDLAPFLTPSDRQMLTTAFTNEAAHHLDFEVARAAVQGLHEAGVPILAGTDAPNPGTTHGASVHGELALLVAAGLTPVEALAAATSATADAFGLGDRGRIAPALRADLVLVDGDPTADIRRTRSIAAIWKGGERFDRSAFQAEVAAEAAAASASGARDAEAIADGIVSDFESGTATTAFGAGWAVSTDAIMGGTSTASFEVVADGDDSHAMKISGKVGDAGPPRFAGVIFSPGMRPLAPADLSDKAAVILRAKGDPGSYVVMLFSEARGFNPSTIEIEVDREWSASRIPLESFDGADGTGVLGLFIGAVEPGPFTIQIDDIAFEAAD